MMTLDIKFNSKSKEIYVDDQSTKDILFDSFFGNKSGGVLYLRPEEALYLIDARKAACFEGETQISFTYLALQFSRKLIIRYITYKDWRDRGLVIRYTQDERRRSARDLNVKTYKSSSKPIKYKTEGTFFEENLTTIVEEDKAAMALYDDHWFGQYGTYKVRGHGRFNKLDIYETMFLAEIGALKIRNISIGRIKKIALKRRKDFLKLYEVYKDWRRRGYIIKTGFKFGTHFRVYFPGAKPMSEGEKWVHSMHVIQVFPRDAKLLISEWARAIRVAHSVRKTFILAIPGKTRRKAIDMDFVLYHRANNNIESPNTSSPRFGMLSISEEEYIGGSELSAIINMAKKERMELVIAIADRETAVTYYKVRRISLEGSKYEYYEIDWMQP